MPVAFVTAEKGYRIDTIAILEFGEYYGLYSKLDDANAYDYLDRSGNHVRATHISKDRYTKYHQPDIVYIGVVTSLEDKNNVNFEYRRQKHEEHMNRL